MSEDKLMSENKLKKYLGDKYTDNPIINFLLYWSIGNDTCPTPKRVFGKEYNDLSMEEREKLKATKNEWRKMNDLDCIWLDGDLNADTIFSLWTPLKMVLECLTDKKFYKVDKYSLNPNNHLEDIMKNIDTYLPRGDQLVEELYKLASLASTRANVMRLHNRGMQKRGIEEKIGGQYKIVESFYEQMPRTLYECFDGGEFRNKFKHREYFKNDNELIEWINSQKLKVFFVESIISKESIKPLIKRMKPYESEWLTNKEELMEMLENYNFILEERQKLV